MSAGGGAAQPLPRFLLENRRWLAAGFLLMFASSFGQTFFVALSGPAIRAEFGLGHGGWGALYAGGTLASAALLAGLGGLADRYRARSLALWVMGGYACVCLAMAALPHWLLIGPVIFGLRFCGQGMMSQIAVTALARWFHARRARAVAVAGLGFSAGAATLPLAALAVQQALGWRAVWVMAAALIALIALAQRWLLKGERTPASMARDTSQPGFDGRCWSRAQALRHWSFWALTLGLLAHPVMATALFFQLPALAQEQGWPPALLAAVLPLAAATTLLANLLLSGLSDRFGARRVIGFYLLPLALGLSAPALIGGDASGGLAFVGLGVTDGVAIGLLGALWPEIYGTRHVGAIRGLAVSSMVFGTALAPAVTGALLDAGVALSTQFLAMAALLLVVSALLGLVGRALSRPG